VTLCCVGTIFLWLYWPSFNSALAPGDDQHRAVINTYYALCSCTVVVFAFSSIVDKENKFSMVRSAENQEPNFAIALISQNGASSMYISHMDIKYQITTCLNDLLVSYSALIMRRR
jgi:hypothetical protein